MRRIEVVGTPCDNILFSTGTAMFRYSQEDKRQMIKYQIELGLPNYNAADVRFLLEDIDPKFEFLILAPTELTEYIKEYEEYSNPNDECLFHDFRTKYVDFIQNNVENTATIQDTTIILGYSLLKEKIYLVIKAFSLKGLSSFLQKIIHYCSNKSIAFKAEKDIRWLELEQYMLETNEKRSGNYKDFLDKTLNGHNFTRFREIFQQIDAEGFFRKDFYDRVMHQENPQYPDQKIPIKQVSKYFSTYWKYSIHLNNRHKDILCLHDEMPTDENVDDYVFTFKPGLMKYYLKEWFEDFTVETIKHFSLDSFHVKYILPGKKFNFFVDEKKENIREIDIVLGIEKESCLKLIAIECKKTLSSDEIQDTNKKCREKVIDSGNNVFDAFLHIGCFKGDVKFDKKIEGTREKYKQSILEGTGSNMDVLYYAFIIKSCEDFTKKFAYILNDIFKNW